MTISRRFYATVEDLKSGIQAIETRRPLKYVSSGWERTPSFHQYDSALDIPEFGSINNNDWDRPIKRSFYVLDKADSFTVETIPQKDGSVYYTPEVSVKFACLRLDLGGIYQQSYKGDLAQWLVFAYIWTPVSYALLHSFARSATKGFTPVNWGCGIWYWLGPEASKLSATGSRLL